jgi:hypothetical protein
MKKVSAAAAKQSRNFSQQKLTIGLDLGDRSSYYGILDDASDSRCRQWQHKSKIFLKGKKPTPSFGECI